MEFEIFGFFLLILILIMFIAVLINKLADKYQDLKKRIEYLEDELYYEAEEHHR